MPVSNDNQDYGKSDEQNKENSSAAESDNKMTSDDLKGKKVDRELGEKKDEPIQQEKQ